MHPPDLQKDIRNLWRQMRHERGWSQSQLADKIADKFGNPPPKRSIESFEAGKGLSLSILFRGLSVLYEAPDSLTEEYEKKLLSIIKSN
jgi:transcriptional regulator with XRE-family HTH domain